MLGFFASILSLSINKTSYSVFSKHANDEHNTTLHLCNNDVQEVNYCKYLRDYVDNTLLRKNHIEYIHKKLLRFVYIFYKLRYKLLNSQILKTLFFYLYSVTIWC